MSSFIAVLASDLLFLRGTPAAAAIVILVVVLLILIAYALSATVLWANSFTAAVILAANEGTANVISRISASIE